MNTFPELDYNDTSEWMVARGRRVIELNVDIARAAATDAGNRNMRKHGRTKWNYDDAIAAHREFSRLMPAVNVLPT